MSKYIKKLYPIISNTKIDLNLTCSLIKKEIISTPQKININEETEEIEYLNEKSVDHMRSKSYEIDEKFTNSKL